MPWHPFTLTKNNKLFIRQFTMSTTSRQTQGPCEVDGCTNLIFKRLDGQPSKFKTCYSCNNKKRCLEEALAPICASKECTRLTIVMKSDTTKHYKYCVVCTQRLRPAFEAKKMCYLLGKFVEAQKTVTPTDELKQAYQELHKLTTQLLEL